MHRGIVVLENVWAWPSILLERIHKLLVFLGEICASLTILQYTYKQNAHASFPRHVHYSSGCLTIVLAICIAIAPFMKVDTLYLIEFDDYRIRWLSSQ